jgi:hypothetical protein
MISIGDGLYFVRASAATCASIAIIDAAIGRDDSYAATDWIGRICLRSEATDGRPAWGGRVVLYFTMGARRRR